MTRILLVASIHPSSQLIIIYKYVEALTWLAAKSCEVEGDDLR